MSASLTPRVVAGLLVVAIPTLAADVTWLWLAGDLRQRYSMQLALGGAESLHSGLVLASLALVTLSLGWFNVAVLVASAGHLNARVSAHNARWVQAPIALRVVVAIAIGVTAAQPAAAEQRGPSAHGKELQRHAWNGLVTPALPGSIDSPSAGHSSRRHTQNAARHVSEGPDNQRSAPRLLVTPGDCLWTLAAHSLKPDATAAQIETAWQLLYAQNRHLIGPNPDLIHPGLVLTAAPKEIS